MPCMYALYVCTVCIYCRTTTRKRKDLCLNTTNIFEKYYEFIIQVVLYSTSAKIFDG